MRVAYVAYLTRRTGEGVLAKLRAQASFWIAEGHDVTVACLTPDDTIVEEVPSRVFRSGWPGRRAAATLSLGRWVGRVRPDVVYVRYDLFFPPLVVGRGRPVVLEVNTDDRLEYALRGRAVRAYNALNRRIAFADAAGAVFVAAASAASPSFARAPSLRTVIPNGIDLDAAPVFPPPANPHPRYVFVGYDSAWQGVDKVLRLADALPESTFEIVGVQPARLGARPANVVAHGPLPQSEVATVLARCDVGVGTLALHRKGIDEAPALKVREYLAHGLPVVLGNRDPDFLGERPWFLLELPNEEANVERNVTSIREFALAVQGRRVAHEEIAHLDLRVKERERLAFLERVIAARRYSAPKRRRR